MIKTSFRSFDGKTMASAKQAEETTVRSGEGVDYSAHIDKLLESIEDRSELTGRLEKLVGEIELEYKRPGKKSYEDMQRFAEQEMRIRLLEKRIVRLTDHIKTYIDYFYTDPCPSDDPLTWGN